MKNITLYYENEEENSNKEYHLQLEKEQDKYVVNFAYGRVGGNLKEGTKTEVPVSLEEAEKIYEKLLKEKKAKGYCEAN